MRLEEVTAEIRPRSDWEAVDLGFALVRRDFWRCLLVWWLALLPPVLLAGWLLKGMPLLLVCLFWWLKPVGSRMVLFELSRRLFGEAPAWKAVFREVPKAWFRRFFYRFCWARFSPWLPVTLAVEDLEGLRGKAYRQRAGQVGRRGDGVVMWIYFLTDLTAGWVALSLFAIAAILLPEGQEGPWTMAFEAFDSNRPLDIPPVIAWTATVCLMLGMSLTDLFVTGAGFGIYVNNRTWLEGWDVELAFKRLSQRLGKVAAVLVAVAAVMMPLSGRGQDDPLKAESLELVQEVKSDPDFTVHVQTYKFPVPKGDIGSVSWLEGLFSFIGSFGVVLGFSLLALFIALLGWLIWKNRHLFRLKLEKGEGSDAGPAARMVMGMEITAESLPDDVPAAALVLWRGGRKREAMALLYRGAISKVAEADVEIRESFTEGDCLRSVEGAGAPAHPDYFRGLTKAWMGMAYAHVEPGDPEVHALCAGWPYPGRRIR